MSWVPSTKELEVLCEHAAVMLPPETTPRMLGVTVEDLAELAGKLAKGREAIMLSKPEPKAAEQAAPSIRAGFPVIIR